MTIQNKVESPKIRVLFVSHTYVVGVNQGKLGALVNSQKVDIGLLVPVKWKTKTWNQKFDLEQAYPKIDYFPAKVLFSGIVGAYIYYPWKIWQVLQDFQPDIIHVEQEVFSLSALQLAFFSRLKNIPLVVFSWENQERDLSLPRRWIRQFVLETAKLLVAGNQDGKHLLQKWNFSGEIEVMPQMGVDTSLFPVKTTESKQQEFNIGYVGRFVECKGIDLLLEAACRLKELKYNFQLTLCGSGEAEKELQAKARQLEIEELVIWKQKVPHAEVPMEMSKFDVLVLPSRSISSWKEQFGHVLIEAMSMGIPTIGSNCGEIPNVIDRQDLVFPEEDVASLTAILQRAIDDRQWYREISSYSIDRIKKCYSHERMAEKHIKLWQTILEGEANRKPAFL